MPQVCDAPEEAQKDFEAVYGHNIAYLATKTGASMVANAVLITLSGINFMKSVLSSLSSFNFVSSTSLIVGLGINAALILSDARDRKELAHQKESGYLPKKRGSLMRAFASRCLVLTLGTGVAAGMGHLGEIKGQNKALKNVDSMCDVTPEDAQKIYLESATSGVVHVKAKNCSPTPQFKR